MFCDDLIHLIQELIYFIFIGINQLIIYFFLYELHSVLVTDIKKFINFYSILINSMFHKCLINYDIFIK